MTALLLTMLAAAQTATPRRAKNAYLVPFTDWDSTRVYRQIVVLYEFNDTTFSMPDPRTYYDSILNVPGCNKGAGPGSAADYLLAQSHGWLHVQFDVFGPYQVNYPGKGTSSYNYGRKERKAATQLFFAENPDLDYSVYDWNNDSVIEQIVYLSAGPSGDETGFSGFIWPNTGMNDVFIDTPDGYPIQQISQSSEISYKSGTKRVRGIGTFVHEFLHCLGLPDVYPLADNTLFSMADEWDLMDGGNMTNIGWCPPNLTAQEKMLLNWYEPVELTSDTTITGLRPVAEGGEAYLIRHAENEYLLLENRQQNGWDSGLPGNGLTIWYVHFDSEAWRYNQVNYQGEYRLRLYTADNMSYEDWCQQVPEADKYMLPDCMRSRWMCTAAYPYRNESTGLLNDCLSENSTPAIVMTEQNSAGNTHFGKSIRNIQMASDGSVSFSLESDPAVALTELAAPADGTRKLLRDGVIYILRNGAEYTPGGQRVR